MATPAPTATAAQKARQVAEKYSGEGQSFLVKYLGTQEVSSAKGDAVIADCLKELRMLFKDVVVHLPKVVVTLQLTGITVTDERSKLETIKAPLDHISYVCLDPADSSVFSFIIHSTDTISSKGLRLHAFVCHPQTAITFNRSARELFDFMARLMRAKRKMAQQETQRTAATSQPTQTSVPDLGLVLPSDKPPKETVQLPAEKPPAASTWPTDKENKQQAVFDEWKELERELDEIGQDLGISSPAQVPFTSTPAASPPSASGSLDPSTFPQLAASPTPAAQPVMTESGSDPFGGSFFAVSYNCSPPPPQTAAVAALGTSSENGGDPNIFDDPLFNGHSDKEEPSSEGVPSTPEGKQLVYASRPRPKGKALDTVAPLSPPPVSDAPADDNRLGGAREVSLSPNSEEEVKSILSNSNPFSPSSLDAFQSPQANSNESGFFQPVSFTGNATPYSGIFSPTSVMAQDSIQLVNPLYQPYPSNGSFSGPFSPPPMQQVQPSPMAPVMMSPPAVLMQPPYTAPQPQIMMPSLQPQLPPDLMGPQPMTPMGMNSFDGILSPTVPPQAGGSGWPPVNPAEAAQMKEQRDCMFSDLLPQTSHPIPEKKKEFEPEAKKVAKPTLAELQVKKRKEQEEAFMASSSPAATDGESEDVVDWPTSPFDDLLSAQPSGSIPEPLPLSSGQQVPSEPTTQEKEAIAQVLDVDNFDAAFKEAGNKGQSIESAFEVPQPQPLPTAAANDPFSPTGTAASPAPNTSSPWSTF